MRRARRTAHLFFRFTDDLLPDIPRLLRGEVELVRQIRLIAVSILTGREYAISLAELELLSSLPSDRWTSVADISLGGQPIDPEDIRRLASAGLIVSDTCEQPLAELYRRDGQLTASGWNPYAALYHTLSKWRDVDAGRLPDTALADTSSRREPPGAFHALTDVLETLDLPTEPQDGLFRLLLERKTTRGFDTGTPITRNELALVLYYTFGCQGFADLGNGLVILKKTSPSGGSLHPVEVYPLVIAVDGLAPGLYHYRIDRHALELLSPLEPNAARELLVQFTAGQSYLSTVPVALIMTARFARSFWKYQSARAYAVLLMDAAHLSQTLYLVCAELGLGAFVSAAVNGANIEERLALDGVEEGVLAICGCGRPALQRSPFDTEFEPYVPRETVIEPGR